MQTHREQLNKMSNEELAEMLAYGLCQYCIYGESGKCFGRSCEQGILDWLNMEVEE